MEIKEMNFEQLEERRAELSLEISGADAERLDTINAELDAIEERKKEIKKEAEERARAIEEVKKAPAPQPIVEERTTEEMEARKTPEYIDAYVDYVKRNYNLDVLSAEKRALLTENAGDDGTIAVPVYVEEKINTAWENDDFMRRIRRTFFKGDVKVGVEVSASGAVIHQEGADAITEEELIIEYVKLEAEFVKKMIRVSHSALALSGTAFLDYLYEELQYQIILKAKQEIIAKVINSSLTEEQTAASLTTAAIISAEGLLEGDASDLVLITTRANAATLKAAALSGSYAYDPFDGLEVMYTSASALNGNHALIVDLNAIQANFPEGDTPKYIFDEYTEAPANMVRIVARLMMGADLVVAGSAVRIGSGSDEG